MEEREIALRCLEFLRAHDSYLVCGHPYPDGDCLGSMIAVGEFLESRRVSFARALFAPLPERYAFMGGMGTFTSIRYLDDLSWVRAVVCLDIGSGERIKEVIGRLPPWIPVLNIDHHASNSGIGGVNWVDTTASSTGELCYRMFRYGNVPVTRNMAEALYIAMVTDTGRFSFSNTRPETLEACAELLRIGVDTDSVNKYLFEQSSMARLKLLAMAIESLRTEVGGLVTVMTVTASMMRQTNTSLQDTYEFIDVANSVKGTRVALLFRELEAGRVRLSMRTDGTVDANAVCRHFDGGGHTRAAAATIRGDIRAVQERVLSYVRRLLREERDAMER